MHDAATPQKESATRSPDLRCCLSHQASCHCTRPEVAPLQVMFTPGGNSHAPQYKQGIPIKITHNSKGPMITCTGSSFMLKAAFDPPLLDLGAILPRFDSQQPNQALLKLINTADVDMEVCFVCAHACMALP